MMRFVFSIIHAPTRNSNSYPRKRKKSSTTASKLMATTSFFYYHKDFNYLKGNENISRSLLNYINNYLTTRRPCCNRTGCLLLPTSSPFRPWGNLDMLIIYPSSVTTYNINNYIIHLDMSTYRYCVR